MPYTNEEKWNFDLIEIIKKKLQADKTLSKLKIMKGKVLKDIFLNQSKTTPKHIVQFGFVDQDIVIYEETMDIKDFHELDHILIHNNEKSLEMKNQMVIPKLIIELKYNGVNSHGLITYSDYASNIKSIFPECKYWLAMRYRKTSSDNKLKRHGKNFDKIFYFSPEKSPGNYTKGTFINDLQSDNDLKSRFEVFVKEIKNSLKERDTNFVK